MKKYWDFFEYTNKSQTDIQVSNVLELTIVQSLFVSVHMNS